MRQPPGLAIKFLKWFCRNDILEDLEGDLLEIYHLQSAKQPKWKSDLNFWWLVLRSFRKSAIKRSKYNNTQIMSITQNLKVAFRVLKRDAFNTTLNVVGLSIGIVCFLLVGMYVLQEVSFDRFHEKKDRIYRSYLYEDYGDGKIFFNAVTPYLFENLFEENFPEVSTSVQVFIRNFNLGRTKPEIKEAVAVISPEFLSVFDFNLIDGDPQKPFTSKNHVVISQAYADKYFGDEYPMGKELVIEMNGKDRVFTVGAIMEDIPYHSSIKFDLAISNENIENIVGSRAMQAWFTVGPETYVLLKEGTDIQSVIDKTQDVIMSRLGEEVQRGEYTIGFQPITDIHLDPSVPVGNAPTANPKYVYTLGIIGLLVLIIASINYTTIYIGQSIKRGKEVGMRKVLGANKRSLFSQYISESILISVISMGIGSLLAFFLIPTFNRLTGTSVHYTFDWWHIGVFLGLALVIGLVAGIYPVSIMSSKKILNVLKSANEGKGNHLIRKGLVSFQFLITAFLISSVFIMQKQLNYLQDKDLGFTYEAKISIPLHPGNNDEGFFGDYKSASEYGEILKQKLLQHPQINSVTKGSHVFGTNGWASLSFTDKEGSFRKFTMLGVDSDFFNLFGIEITEGRFFEKGNGLDERRSIIINETAASYFGWEDPIGKKLPNDNFGEHQIIGVCKDFNFSSLHNDITPLVITQNVEPIIMGASDGDYGDSPIPKLIVSYSSDKLLDVERILEESWKEVYPNLSLNFDFLDERMALLYQSEKRFQRLVSVSAVLSIIIASIGLLGLTVLVINSREKEMGIRKVLGASKSEIFILFSKSFLWQLVIGITLSVPITYLLMKEWLAGFAYRVNMGVEMFLLSGFISIFITLVVISFHTMKAANSNPTQSLRSE